ncbi:MAG: hypothetical protein AABY22_23700 [Nanoarchaeota archaeon]
MDKLLSKCPICNKGMIWWLQDLKDYEFKVENANLVLKVRCHVDCFRDTVKDALLNTEMRVKTK